MYLLYECKAFSFKYISCKINLWKSAGLNNYTRDSDKDAVSVATTSLYGCCICSNNKFTTFNRQWTNEC